MPIDNVSDSLFSRLKNLFPQIRLGDKDGMSTTDPKNASFFDFDFTIQGEKLASVSISIAEEGTLKLFYTKDILQDQNESIKDRWFEFLRNMRSFAKRNLLNFDPKDITKQNLDKRDYKYLANSAGNNKTEDLKMSESSLYGSTKSSYQTLENTKLIIRHSKRIEEESPNSRTRNIQAIYVESSDGERFKYPFIHLSGARAMQRHVSNGGNPYDAFGQYVVGLSEQIYSLRKFGQLVGRNAFLENSEVSNIAIAARQKTIDMKKTLESIQKQRGYEDIKENFTAFVKKDLKAEDLETLKNKFTVNKFNEELVDLFPYISDLLGEENIDGVLDELSPATLSSYKSKAADSEKDSTDKSSSLRLHPKERDLNGKKANNRRQGMKLATSKLAKEEIQFEASDIQDEAVQFKKGEPGKAQGKPTGDYDDSDAAQEPVTDYKDRPRDEAYDLKIAIENATVIKMEPFDKATIRKEYEKTVQQINSFKQAAAENPRDKKAQYAVEKAEARLGLLKSRFASADPQAKDNVTRNALMIEHLSVHVKDDKISLLLSRIADDYRGMDKDEQKEVNDLIRQMMSKVKLVPMFTNETTSFEELETILNKDTMNLETAADQIKFDIVREYEDALNNIITERNDLLSNDPDIREQAIQNLSDLMKEHFPAGTNGINAIESLRGIIDDPKLFIQFKQVSQENADSCVRPLIIDWINNNAPDIAEKFSSNNIDQEKEDKVVPPNSEMGQSENYSMQELAEFIRSFYDKDTNTFPKGPEGVSIMVGKKFGENAEMLARKMVEMLAPMQDGDKVSEINRIKELAGLH